MKKQLMMAALALVMAPTLALAAPDLTGTWARDNAKSEVVPNSMYWLTRGVDAGSRGTTGEFVLEVKQAGGRLMVTDPTRPLRNYALDGQTRTVKADTGITNQTVKAAVQGETVVVDIVQPFGGMPGNATLTVKETWSLSPDGKVLTVKSERVLPGRRQAYSEVFNRR